MDPASRSSARAPLPPYPGTLYDPSFCEVESAGLPTNYSNNLPALQARHVYPSSAAYHVPYANYQPEIAAHFASQSHQGYQYVDDRVSQGFQGFQCHAHGCPASYPSVEDLVYHVQYSHSSFPNSNMENNILPMARSSEDFQPSMNSNQIWPPEGAAVYRGNINSSFNGNNQPYFVATSTAYGNSNCLPAMNHSSWVRQQFNGQLSEKYPAHYNLPARNEFYNPHTPLTMPVHPYRGPVFDAPPERSLSTDYVYLVDDDSPRSECHGAFPPPPPTVPIENLSGQFDEQPPFQQSQDHHRIIAYPEDRVHSADYMEHNFSSPYPNYHGLPSYPFSSSQHSQLSHIASVRTASQWPDTSPVAKPARTEKFDLPPNNHLLSSSVPYVAPALREEHVHSSSFTGPTCQLESVNNELSTVERPLPRRRGRPRKSESQQEMPAQMSLKGKKEVPWTPLRSRVLVAAVSKGILPEHPFNDIAECMKLTADSQLGAMTKEQRHGRYAVRGLDCFEIIDPRTGEFVSVADIHSTCDMMAIGRVVCKGSHGFPYCYLRPLVKWTLKWGKNFDSLPQVMLYTETAIYSLLTPSQRYKEEFVFFLDSLHLLRALRASMKVCESNIERVLSRLRMQYDMTEAALVHHRSFLLKHLTKIDKPRLQLDLQSLRSYLLQLAPKRSRSRPLPDRPPRAADEETSRVPGAAISNDHLSKLKPILASRLPGKNDHTSKLQPILASKLLVSRCSHQEREMAEETWRDTIIKHSPLCPIPHIDGTFPSREMGKLLMVHNFLVAFGDQIALNISLDSLLQYLVSNSPRYKFRSLVMAILQLLINVYFYVDCKQADGVEDGAEGNVFMRVFLEPIPVNEHTWIDLLHLHLLQSRAPLSLSHSDIALLDSNTASEKFSNFLLDATLVVDAGEGELAEESDRVIASCEKRPSDDDISRIVGDRLSLIQCLCDQLLETGKFSELIQRNMEQLLDLEKSLWRRAVAEKKKGIQNRLKEKSINHFVDDEVSLKRDDSTTTSLPSAASATLVNGEVLSVVSKSHLPITSKIQDSLVDTVMMIQEQVDDRENEAVVDLHADDINSANDGGIEETYVVDVEEARRKDVGEGNIEIDKYETKQRMTAMHDCVPFADPELATHQDELERFQQNVRVLPLGRDREQRTYWILPGIPGVLVQDIQDQWGCCSTQEQLDSLLASLSTYLQEERLLLKVFDKRKYSVQKSFGTNSFVQQLCLSDSQDSENRDIQKCIFVAGGRLVINMPVNGDAVAEEAELTAKNERKTEKTTDSNVDDLFMTKVKELFHAVYDAVAASLVNASDGMRRLPSRSVWHRDVEALSLETLKYAGSLMERLWSVLDDSFFRPFFNDRYRDQWIIFSKCIRHPSHVALVLSAIYAQLEFRKCPENLICTKCSTLIGKVLYSFCTVCGNVYHAKCVKSASGKGYKFVCQECEEDRREQELLSSSDEREAGEKVPSSFKSNSGTKLSDTSASADEAITDITSRKSRKSLDDATCGRCSNGGRLLMCDGCPKMYHLYCLRPRLKSVPGGQWFCPDCQERSLSVEPMLLRPRKK